MSSALPPARWRRAGTQPAVAGRDAQRLARAHASGAGRAVESGRARRARRGCAAARRASARARAGRRRERAHAARDRVRGARASRSRASAVSIFGASVARAWSCSRQRTLPLAICASASASASARELREALAELARVLVGRDRERAHERHRARVHLALDAHHRDAGLRVAREQRARDRRGAAVARQHARVRVHEIAEPRQLADRRAAGTARTRPPRRDRAPLRAARRPPRARRRARAAAAASPRRSAASDTGDGVHAPAAPARAVGLAHHDGDLVRAAVGEALERRAPRTRACRRRPGAPDAPSARRRGAFLFRLALELLLALALRSGCA